MQRRTGGMSSSRQGVGEGRGGPAGGRHWWNTANTGWGRGGSRKLRWKRQTEATSYRASLDQGWNRNKIQTVVNFEQMSPDLLNGCSVETKHIGRQGTKKRETSQVTAVIQVRNNEGWDSGGSGTCGEDIFLNEKLTGLANGLDAGFGGERF